MGLHTDDEPELGPDPLVAIVSLGFPGVSSSSRADEETTVGAELGSPATAPCS